MSEYTDFINEKLGKNWVIARRTSNIVRRYGEDVKCVSQSRYKEVENQYHAIYGDPYDKVRAQMFLALVAAYENLRETCAPETKELRNQLAEAINAEKGR